MKFWDIVKTELGGKFITVNTLRKEKKSHIHKLVLYLKELENERIKLKVKGRKEIIRLEHR